MAYDKNDIDNRLDFQQKSKTILNHVYNVSNCIKCNCILLKNIQRLNKFHCDKCFKG